MTSKQSPQQQSTPISLIFSNVSFEDSDGKLLRDLKSNYSGVKSVSRLYLDDNCGKTINAIQIELKADTLARQFLENKNIGINGEHYSIQSSTRSLIVSKVPFSGNEGKLLQDWGHNYVGIESIYRFVDSQGYPIDSVRIDCKTDSLVTKIIKDKYILLDGKRRPVQPYWTLIFTASERKKELAPENLQKPVVYQAPVVEQPRNVWTKPPQNYLSEQRVKELFNEQRMQLEAMIREFENRWTSRLSSVSASSSNPNPDQLSPILKDLTTVCQQFNQQNAQLQRQLGSVVNRVQDVQKKSPNEQTQQSWP